MSLKVHLWVAHCVKPAMAVVGSSIVGSSESSIPGTGYTTTKDASGWGQIFVLFASVPIIF